MNRFACAVGLLLCSGTLATIQGPIFPPTNGVNFQFTGAADETGGQFNTYTHMDMNGVDARWWGDTGEPIINSLSNQADIVWFDPATSNLPAGHLAFAGTSMYYFYWNGVLYGANVSTRFTVDVYRMNGLRLSFIQGWQLGIPAQFLCRVDAQDFQVRIRFEARDPVTGDWFGTRNLYNRYNNIGQGERVSFSAGFYEDIYCPADFNNDGGIDGADVEAFFAAWEAGDATGDTNRDGGIDGSDVQAFFAAWEAGGC